MARALLLAALLAPAAAFSGSCPFETCGGAAQSSVQAGGRVLQATPGPLQRRVTVSGQGVVLVAPDRATVDFTVTSIAATPAAASAANEAASAAVLSATRGVVPAENVTLTALSVQPNEVYIPPSFPMDSGRTIQSGYIARRSVTVVTTPALVPAVVNAVLTTVTTTPPANATEFGTFVSLDSVSYSLAPATSATARQQALSLATTDAIGSARAIVASLPGVALGGVVEAREASASTPSPQTFRAMEASAAAPAPNPEAFAPGTVEVRASVNPVTFELVPAASR